MTTTFTGEEDLILVKTIKSFEVLYNSEHEKHKDNAFKATVWNEIATKIGKTVNQCKKRWKNIKAAYLKNKSNSVSTDKFWPIHKYVTFLDGDKFHQNANFSGSKTETLKNELKEYQVNDNASPNGILKQNTGPSCSYTENNATTEEDCIAVVVAKELLKGKNAMSNNNTSFTITIQNNKIATSTMKPVKKEEKLKERKDVEVVHRYGQTSPQHLQVSAPDAVPSHVTRSTQSKETNTILYSLLKQFEMLSEQSENFQSLDLFFKSVLVDLDNFCPQAIDDVKLKILNCVSDVKGIHSRSDVSHNSSASFLLSEENITLNNSMKQMEMLNIKSETAKSLNLFFKSVMVDMKDFNEVAMTDAKIRILKCVSEIRDTTYPDFSVVSNEFIPNTNHLSMEGHPILETVPIQTGQYRNVPIPYNMVYNVPIYCNNNQHNYQQ